MSRNMKALQRFVGVYNQAVRDGMPSSWVARRLGVSLREVALLKYSIRKAEKEEGIKRSCLVGELSRKETVKVFVSRLHKVKDKINEKESRTGVGSGSK